MQTAFSKQIKLYSTALNVMPGNETSLILIKFEIVAEISPIVEMTISTYESQ